MFVNKRRRINTNFFVVEIDSNLVIETQEVKFLGVFVDSDLA